MPPQKLTREKSPGNDPTPPWRRCLKSTTPSWRPQESLRRVLGSPTPKTRTNNTPDPLTVKNQHKPDSIALTKRIKQEIIDDPHKRKDINHNIHHLLSQAAETPTTGLLPRSQITPIPEQLSQFLEYQKRQPKKQDHRHRWQDKSCQQQSNTQKQHQQHKKNITSTQDTTKRNTKFLCETTGEKLNQQKIGKDDDKKRDTDINEDDEHNKATMDTHLNPSHTQNINKYNTNIKKKQLK